VQQAPKELHTHCAGRAYTWTPPAHKQMATAELHGRRAARGCGMGLVQNICVCKMRASTATGVAAVGLTWGLEPHASSTAQHGASQATGEDRPAERKASCTIKGCWNMQGGAHPGTPPLRCRPQLSRRHVPDTTVPAACVHGGGKCSPPRKLHARSSMRVAGCSTSHHTTSSMIYIMVCAITTVGSEA
jgi:hypothetical protein